MYELPPNGQGVAALEMLNIMERFPLAKYGFHSPKAMHVMIEAKKLAYADRAKFYADPTFAKVPVSELISKGYADGRGKLIDPLHALTDIPAGDPKIGRSDTIYLCVVDKDRN